MRVSNIADRIRAILKEKGWSERQLAREAKFKTESQVSNILRRLDESPDAVELGTLKQVARGAGVSERWLITGIGSPAGDDNATVSPPNDDRSPRVGNASNWPALLKVARALAPDVADWAWEMAERSNPLVTAPLTPIAVAELGRFIMRHELPPNSRASRAKPANESGTKKK